MYMSHSTKIGKFGQSFLVEKINTNNFDLFYFNLKSEQLTTIKHICIQENLCNNIFLTYFNSCTGTKCHSCYRNMKKYFLKKSIILVSFFFLTEKGPVYRLVLFKEYVFLII